MKHFTVVNLVTFAALLVLLFGTKGTESSDLSNQTYSTIETKTQELDTNKTVSHEDVNFALRLLKNGLEKIFNFSSDIKAKINIAFK